MRNHRVSNRGAVCRPALAAAAACAAALSFAQVAEAADLMVRFDQSQLLRLPRAASEVIIGNPSIADVAIQGGNLLVVTGKMFGVTNIIALDAQRNVIQDQRVVVEHDDQRTVVLFKGAERRSYTCTPTCTPTITVGDSPDYFDVINRAAQAKSSASTGAPDRGNQESGG